MRTKFAQSWSDLEALIPANSPQAFGFATVCIVAATAIRWALEGKITLLFPTYYPTILLISLVCGFAVTLYAIALSIGAAWWLFMPPAHGLDWSSGQVLNISLYAFATTLIAWIGDSRRRLDEKARLLTRELQHRGKNQLMLVRAILLQTLRRDSDLEKALNRIVSLAITEDLLSQSQQKGVSLQELAGRELKSFGDRVSIQGPPIILGSDIATVTILALHEFGTNATKYGALSNAGGRVILTWAAEKQLRITWRETNGPSVRPPATMGEGLELVERLVSGTGGKLLSDFQATGVVHQLFLPNSTSKSRATTLTLH